MSWKILKMVLLPSNVMLAATPVIAANSKETEKVRTAIRPSELPIYVDEVKRGAVLEETSAEVSVIEEAVGTVRKQLCSLMSEVNSVSRKASSIFNENLEASNEILDFLKEEENVLPRSGAIALGGLTGLVFAIRRGFFKRLIYMSLGAGGVASLCYPKEAEEYFNEGMVAVRKYGLIGHHLATSSFNFFEKESIGEDYLHSNEDTKDEHDSSSPPVSDLEEGTAAVVIQHKYSTALEHASNCAEPSPSLMHNHQAT